MLGAAGKGSTSIAGVFIASCFCLYYVQTVRCPVHASTCRTVYHRQFMRLVGCVCGFKPETSCDWLRHVVNQWVAGCDDIVVLSDRFRGDGTIFRMIHRLLTVVSWTEVFGVMLVSLCMQSLQCNGCTVCLVHTRCMCGHTVYRYHAFRGTACRGAPSLWHSSCHDQHY